MINYYINTKFNFADNLSLAIKARIAERSEWEPLKQCPGVGERKRAGGDSPLVLLKSFEPKIKWDGFEESTENQIIGNLTLELRRNFFEELSMLYNFIF